MWTDFRGDTLPDLGVRSGKLVLQITKKWEMVALHLQFVEQQELLNL